MRLAFIATNSPTLIRPEILVAKAADKFSAEGQLTDQLTLDLLKTFLEAFSDFMGRFATR